MEKNKPPYGHTRMLMTNYPGGDLTSKEAHTTAINPRNAAAFSAAWTYLLLENCD